MTDSRSELEKLPKHILTKEISSYLTLYQASCLAKTNKNLHRLFQPLAVVLTPRISDVLKDSALSSKQSEFNQTEIKNYIDVFITKSVSGKGLGYKDVDSILQKINTISHLSKIIKHPTLLMITMHALPYLEKFYIDQNDSCSLSEDVVQKDLLHIFTNLVITDTANVIRIKHNNLLNIGRFSIAELILNYHLSVAKLMNSSPDLLEIKEEELSATQNKTLIQKRHLFHSKYYPPTFKDDQRLKVNLCRENCAFIQKTGEVREQHYTFIHQLFLDYFATLLPQAINGRRKMIEEFMKDFHPDEDLSPRTSLPFTI